MTVIVGIHCKDAIVVGSDSSATFSGPNDDRTIEQETIKIEIIDGRIIVAGAGEVGKGQRFKEIIKKASKEDKFTKDKTPHEVANYLSHQTIKDFAFTFSGNQAVGIFGKHSYGAVMAFPLGSRLSLFEFGGDNFQPELKTDTLWFVSIGNGQRIADTFLAFLKQVFWEKKIPTRAEGIFAAIWTIQLAIDINPGGINEPIQLAVLSHRKGQGIAEIIPKEKVQEHLENVKEAKLHLSKFRFGDDTTQPFPTAPGKI